MKLAASNIAWPAVMDEEAYRILRRFGIRAIEVAPTRIWPNWQGADSNGARHFRRQVEEQGFQICSLQAILFQKPELRLFGSDRDRENLWLHLRLCADLAAELGAGRLVFGAPKNRDPGDLSQEDAFARAVEFFLRLAPHYSARGVRLVFEANPVEYGCHFATENQTAGRLVRAVHAEGMSLHLDTGCMQLAGEDATSTIAENADIVAHFHASEPNLANFASPSPIHQAAAAALARVGYAGYVALEMRAGDSPAAALEEAAAYLVRTYASSN